MRALLFLTIFTITSCGNVNASDLFEQYVWQKRVLLIFSPSMDNDLYLKQKNFLASNKAGILERDIVEWNFIYGEQVSIDNKLKPHLPTQTFYNQFDVKPEDFTVILLGKDGGQKLRKTSTTLSNDELFELIDSMPMRKNEMRK